MDGDSLIVYIKTDGIYKDIAEDVETRFNNSNHELDRLLLPKEKNKTVIDLMKDKLDGKIMKEFVGLRAKTYTCVIDNASEDKKAKNTKKHVIKRKLKLKDYKNCLKTTHLENKIKQLEKNKVNTESLRENHKKK